MTFNTSELSRRILTKLRVLSMPRSPNIRKGREAGQENNNMKHDGSGYRRAGESPRGTRVRDLQGRRTHILTHLDVERHVINTSCIQESRIVILTMTKINLVELPRVVSMRLVRLNVTRTRRRNFGTRF